jgi:septum formation protein
MLLPEHISDLDIILASQSPRRKELLESTGIPFRQWVLPVEEDFPEELPPVEIARFLSKQKAKAFEGKITQNMIVITADTIVVNENQILNKASDHAQAYQMLRFLSGKAHEVITGVCISSADRQRCFHDITRVYFKTLTDEEINYYIKNYTPFDKAGAYGIQEWIGSVAVSRIEGSYHNVVGLPVGLLYQELGEFITKNF